MTFVKGHWLCYVTYGQSWSCFEKITSSSVLQLSLIPGSKTQGSLWKQPSPLWYHLPLLIPFAKIHHSQIKQSVPRVSEGQSLLVRAATHPLCLRILGEPQQLYKHKNDGTSSANCACYQFTLKLAQLALGIEEQEGTTTNWIGVKISFAIVNALNYLCNVPRWARV